MKLTDFSILFFSLFICAVLSIDLSFERESASIVSEIIFNKNLDRANEDSLLDVVKTEDDEGLPVVDVFQIKSSFTDGVEKDLDITDDYSKSKAEKAFSLKEYDYQNPVTESIYGPSFLTDFTQNEYKREVMSGSRIVKKKNE